MAGASTLKISWVSFSWQGHNAEAPSLHVRRNVPTCVVPNHRGFYSMYLHKAVLIGGGDGLEERESAINIDLCPPSLVTVLVMLEAWVTAGGGGGLTLLASLPSLIKDSWRTAWETRWRQCSNLFAIRDVTSIANMLTVFGIFFILS